MIEKSEEVSYPLGTRDLCRVVYACNLGLFKHHAYSAKRGLVDTVGVHDLVPSVDEVADEFLCGVIAGVDLCNGAQL